MYPITRVIAFCAVIALIFLAFQIGKGVGAQNGVSGTSYYDTTTVTVYDTSFTEVLDTTPVLLPQSPFDTLEVLKRYFANRKFTSSAQGNDVQVDIQLEMAQNAPTLITYDIQNLRETQIDLNNRISLGMFAGKNLAGPKISYQHKKWRANVGYNLVQNEFSPKWVLGVEYELFAW